MAGKSFAYYVEENIARRAGFNQSYANIFLGDGIIFYFGQIPNLNPERNLNLIVIESPRYDFMDGRRRKRTDWYFGTVLGPHSGQCESEEEAEEFLRKAGEIKKRKNRIADRYLEDAIMEQIKML